MPSLKKLVPSWVKAPFRLMLAKYRQATWRSRCLPDFIIIGTQRGGTTSLFSYLGQHPHLFPSSTKEVHFFDGGLKPQMDNFRSGLPWYQAHFPLKRNLGAHQKAFEASPLYMYNPLVPKRISELLPNVKLIAILRQPTERAISHYFHEKKLGYETLPMREAFQAEEARLKPVVEKEDYKNDIFTHQSYKTRGHYSEQIKKYLNYFPRSNLLLLSSEKFFAEPQNTLQQIFRFVGVDADFVNKDLEPRNTGGNKTTIEPDIYEYLNDYFRPHNQALYALTGEDYGW